MGERAHLSIGEVLALVQEEFPDITISKIRFLESQGLLDPERTPSGYRKFYPADIERLQWILLQQRDHFLPLKVIRERLAEWDATGTRPSGTHQTPAAEDLPGADQGGPEQGSGPQDTAGLDTERPEDAASPEPGAGADVGQDGDRVEAAVDSGGDEAGESEEMSASRSAASSLAAGSAMEVAAPAREPAAPSEEPVEAQTETDDATVAEPSPPGGLQVGPQDSALTAEELADQAGVDVRVVHELEGFSMIESRRVGPETYYDPEYLDIVRACRAFLDHGVEVRHLRMYKIAAEREAGVLEQLIMPLLKQRNPDARARAVDTVRELSQVGEELHAALLRHALRHTLP